MADIIDFKAKKKEREVEVELEQDGQQLLEAGIVALWTVIGGERLRSIVESDQYLYFFLQFSGVCFESMEQELLIIDEDGNLGIAVDLRESMEDAVKDIEAELATKH